MINKIFENILKHINKSNRCEKNGNFSLLKFYCDAMYGSKLLILSIAIFDRCKNLRMHLHN